MDAFIAGMSFFNHKAALIDCGALFITGGNDEVHPPIVAQNILIELGECSTEDVLDHARVDVRNQRNAH